MLYVDALLLKRMMISAANNISNNREAIDKLNVFPVPDGDTGSNMSMTALSISEKLQALPEDSSLFDVVTTVTQAALRGARGNSGVIFSQLIRGFSDFPENTKSLYVSDIAEAFQKGVDLAYNAVMRPTEGTMLTVAKDVAAEASLLSKQEECSVEELFEAIVKKAEESLNTTPQFLPILKQAGVVDSGGMGLLKIYEGMLLSIKNKDVKSVNIHIHQENKDTNEYAVRNDGVFSPEDIKFIYCTEFIINKNPMAFDVVKFKNFVSSSGDSEVIVDSHDTIKVHVHTNNPGEIISRACRLGELSSIKIDNMKIQHEEKLSLNYKGGQKTYDSSEDFRHDEKFKEFSIVSIASGEGFSKIFTDMGVDLVIGGRNYINPSADDIVKACEKINAKDIFVLPNDKNIILTARQAKQLSDKNIIVIPTKTVPQGISCALAFDETLSLEENERKMNFAIKDVKTISVTHASKSLNMGGKDIKDGDALAIVENKVKFVGSDVHDVAYKAISDSLDDSISLVTIFYNSPDLLDDAKDLIEKFENENSNVEFVAEFGGQEIYNYIISVE